MKHASFWRKDWLVGLLVSLLFLLAAGSDLMQSLERKAYDLGVMASTRVPSDKITIIAIDDQSIANLGRWPWPREIHARLIDLLAEGQAKVVGHTVLFTEPQVEAGLAYVGQVSSWLDASSIRSSGNPAHRADVARLEALLEDAARKLDNDRKLGESLGRAGRVQLAMYFEPGEPQGKPDKPLPDYVLRHRLTQVQASPAGAQPDPSQGVLLPIPVLGSQASGLGHLNVSRDVDGAVRSEPLLMGHYGDYYPSLSLMLAARSLNLKAEDIRVQLGSGVQLGQRFISTDPTLRMQTFFYKDAGGRPAFPVDSFYDVLSGKIPATKYRDKIVLIGASAAGVGTLQVTPIAASMPSVVTLAHTVSSILNGDYFLTPTWGTLAQLGIFLAVALYLILLLPRLRAATGALVTGAIFVALLLAHFGLMTMYATWLPLMLPVVLLLVGHLLLTSKHFLLAEAGKQKSDAESAESNRMLGLAFQGQGQLDMAFEKFSKVPMDDGLMELLYNLALDFERKRQFNKAEAVFRRMAGYNRKFRDLEARLAQSKAMAETVILGGATRGNDSTLVLDRPGVAKPMLGRYEVEKELGKGAMGVVYLGRDPKIGRLVAIKTLALAQEFDADVLQEVKQRFFSEAESAGRLSHPNIVTMFDAGEEHDLAYIAMEYLKGRDLVAYIKPGALLPLPVVMGIVARVADALDYAHRQNVVHRDIKPGNIMYDPGTDTVKVADFGIARITDSSKTRTGMVMGTPSYMSPEQLAGHKVSGASDLFSLGVMLYQLACGRLPFDGDSMAQLMYRIANEAPTDILSVRADLPPCLVAILAKALAKPPGDRYASGAELAEALRQCAATLPKPAWEATVPATPGAGPAWSDTVPGGPDLEDR